jgi:pyrimidine dimer DNA glycosylase
MRLWTLHPRYLDARGLVALWREALLAQKVLQGRTRGYRHHPQLARFQAQPNPAAALASYLRAVHEEAVRRGYQFDGRKIGARRSRGKIVETDGQLLYEWRHLRRKLKQRDRPTYARHRGDHVPEAHPLFRIVPGGVREWERVK